MCSILQKRKASALLTSSSFLQKDGVEAVWNIKKLLEPNKDNFTQEQADSAVELICSSSDLICQSLTDAPRAYVSFRPRLCENALIDILVS
jgi:hypothetical protein